MIALAPFEQRFFNLQNDRPIRAVLYDEYVNEDLALDHPELYPDGPPVENLGFVEKENGAEIPLGIFNDNQYECLSAVIFNNAATFSKLQALANKKRGKNNDQFDMVNPTRWESKAYRKMVFRL
ncbi:hypothetical protein LD112_20520 [Pantoea agglomerans]|nr:hypothetical protein [Pantoea agglomerans]